MTGSATLCLDIGSTWTKAALVSGDGTLLATAGHPTTPPEVRTGIDAVRAAVGAGDARALACSSAGGGLRLAVVGQERLVSAEAGRRAALSAGARVVHVEAGPLDAAALGVLVRSAPDIVLLTGGTDGGDVDVLRYNAASLAANPLPCPVVLAGNGAIRGEVAGTLRGAGMPVVDIANVLPDIGELAVGEARAAIRELFLSTVIGGKGLSSWDGFGELVRTVTPDAVLSGVTRLATVRAARDRPGAVLVVDVGGATTDVYSAVPDTTGGGRAAHAVGLGTDRRTVEGDLGVRFSAPGVAVEATEERLLDAGCRGPLRERARYRAGHVHAVPGNGDEARWDGVFARLAAVIALRRHVRMADGDFGPRGVGLVVLSGGALRHATPETLEAVRSGIASDPPLRPLLRGAAITVDSRYVLAPAGLLAADGDVRAADVLVTGLSREQVPASGSRVR